MQLSTNQSQVITPDYTNRRFDELKAKAHERPMPGQRPFPGGYAVNTRTGADGQAAIAGYIKHRNEDTVTLHQYGDGPSSPVYSESIVKNATGITHCRGANPNGVNFETDMMCVLHQRPTR